MAEYTYGNIVFNPTSEDAKSCVGKMVYYADSPNQCLRNANDNDFCGILQGIDEGTNCPFILRSGHWGCIILKKEESKPEYIPFGDMEEFVKASLIHNKNHYLAGTGIWIEKIFKANNKPICLSMVSGYADKAILVDGYWIELDKILDSYRFLDGSPCGKLKETNNG